MARRSGKMRHWTREETLNLIAVWGEPAYQQQFETMIHNHTVWEKIFVEVVRRCPSIQDFGEWTKLKDRIDYLKRKYRESVKNNAKTGSAPQHSPYFMELDAVLGCRPMNNPGELRLDRGTLNEDEAESSGESTTRPPEADEDEPQDVSQNSEATTASEACLQPQAKRQRKGRKTQVMEALDKGLDRLCQQDNAYERERLQWEKEVEKKRLELENKRLEFEIQRMEADERKARENREFMLQLFQVLRPPAPAPFPHMPPQQQPLQPPQQGTMDPYPTAPGPPAPAAHRVPYYDSP